MHTPFSASLLPNFPSRLLEASAEWRRAITSTKGVEGGGPRRPMALDTTTTTLNGRTTLRTSHEIITTRSATESPTTMPIPAHGPIHAGRTTRPLRGRSRPLVVRWAITPMVALRERDVGLLASAGAIGPMRFTAETRRIGSVSNWSRMCKARLLPTPAIALNTSTTGAFAVDDSRG